MVSLTEKLSNLIDYRTEFDELLGPGRRNSRSCYNTAAHKRGDRSPSLSFNPSNGGWKCHTCGKKGDIYTLYQEVKGVEFKTALEYFAKKYGVWSDIVDVKQARRRVAEDKRFATIRKNASTMKTLRQTQQWLWEPKREHFVEFLNSNYMLSDETIKEYGLGYNANDHRLWIPIPSFETDGAVVNIKRHDTFRRRCQWVNTETGEVVKRGRPKGHTEYTYLEGNHLPWAPKWSSRSGKCYNTKGHGACYLYPFEQMSKGRYVLLVGGELKALALIERDIPSVTFTGGEGSIANEFLPYFIGKDVDILYDADPQDKGNDEPLSPVETAFLEAYNKKFGQEKRYLSNMERASIKTAVIMSSIGADVHVIVWPQDVKEMLPDKGDVTDLLKLFSGSTSCLDLLHRMKFERIADPSVMASLEEATLGKKDEIPPLKEMPEVSFKDLVNPQMIDGWVRTKAIVSGRSEQLFAVPSALEASCPRGRNNSYLVCSECALPQSGYRRTLRFSVPKIIDMVGRPTGNELKRQRKLLGINPKCQRAEISTTAAAIDKVVLSPMLDGVMFEHATRSAYFVGTKKVVLQENVAYEISGKLMSDPKTGRFTFAAVDWSPVTDDIHTFKRHGKTTRELDKAFGKEKERYDMYMSELRDHIVGAIYGQDDMLLAIALTMFMPFKFEIGGDEQERLCPNVMILGDTTVGKSTVVSKLQRFYSGSGVLYAASSDPTYAGLIGGNTKRGGEMSYSWGVIPNANRGWFGLDEYNKLSTDIIGQLTNVVSSGIAERMTVTGPKRTQAWVRMLALANPRGERPLSTYIDPLQAAADVVRTRQDLGRFDFVYIQPQNNAWKEAMWEARKNVKPSKLTPELAHYHLSWAWWAGRQKSRILFKAPTMVYRESLRLSEKFNNHVLLLSQQARFKLGRIAAGFAAMLFSHDRQMNLVVNDHHVRLAADFLDRTYTKYMTGTSAKTGMFPEELIEIFDTIKRYRRLNFLGFSSFTREDVESIFGKDKGADVIAILHYEYPYISLSGRKYIPRRGGALIKEHLDSYLAYRKEKDLGEIY